MILALLVAAAASSSPPIAPLTKENPESKGTMGVEFELPGNVGAPDLGLTYFLADGLAARVNFGLDALLAPSGAPAVFNIGVELRFYQLRHGPVAAFLAPALAFGREKISATDAAEFLAFSGAVGVEYFFTDHLSAGGQLGLGLKLGNLGAPGGPVAPPVSARLTTATSGIFASIYF
jgi:hypothetical protein